MVSAVFSSCQAKEEILGVQERHQDGIKKDILYIRLSVIIQQGRKP